VNTSGTEARLRAHVAALAGTIGERHILRPRALGAAADYIEAGWRTQGYAPEREPVPAGGAMPVNLVATRPGRGRAEDILLIGAHYDTVRGSPGADDNASGVAGLIELLERNKEALGVQYYSVGGATLEKVFLNVVRENNVREEDGMDQRNSLLRRLLLRRQ